MGCPALDTGQWFDTGQWLVRVHHSPQSGTPVRAAGKQNHPTVLHDCWPPFVAVERLSHGPAPACNPVLLNTHVLENHLGASPGCSLSATAACARWEGHRTLDCCYIAAGVGPAAGSLVARNLPGGLQGPGRGTLAVQASVYTSLAVGHRHGPCQLPPKEGFDSSAVPSVPWTDLPHPSFVMAVGFQSCLEAPEKTLDLAAAGDRRHGGPDSGWTHWRQEQPSEMEHLPEHDLTAVREVD